MASYVTTGFSKQLLVYTSYIFYVDPLIRETLSTVISYRKSSPSRPISSSIFCAPHSNLPRIPTLSYRNVIEARKYDQYVPWSHPARKVRCYSREQLDEMMTACASAELPAQCPPSVAFTVTHSVDDGDANYDGAIFRQRIFSLLGRGRKTRPDMNRDALVRII